MKKIISLLLIIIMTAALMLPAAAQGDFETPIVVPPELNAQSCTVTLSESVISYTGKPVTPSVSVTFTDESGEAKQLSENTDYTLSYQNNTAVGKATVQVIAAGEYTGSVSADFVIAPAGMKACRIDAVNYKAIKMSIYRQTGADGYRIGIAKAGTADYKYYDSDGTKPLYFKNLSDKTAYKFRIRAFVTIDGVRYYGASSDTFRAKTAAAVGTANISGWCQLNAKPYISWSAVKGAQKYIVYRSTEKDGHYKKLGTTAACAVSDKTAKVHQTYYYAVKAYTVIDKTAYTGYASNIIKVKAMKTVFVGDSVMEGVRIYQAYPATTYLTKIGLGTYSFYTGKYFQVGERSATGVEKLISYQPDRIFIMLGMNEITYKSNAGVLEYYGYAIKKIQKKCPSAQIVLLPVSPTTAGSGSTIPKKGRINSFNKALKQFARERGCAYYDYTAPFKDANGYLTSACNGGDGCHWNPYSAKLFIKQITKYIKCH